jgi:nucleoside-diphosphate-sugar epimerase
VRLLVLGGTKFLGRAAVESALERGHEVTLFNRGETNPELFPQAERLRGDRDGDLSALEGREWDAVIDPSGFVPRVLRASAELLRDAVGHYVFVSSISVYREPYEPDFDEDAPVFEVEPRTEEVLEEYAELKAACERLLAEVLPGSHASVRAGLIVGPHDPTGRFTYWPLRVAQGGDVLAPAPPERRVQFVDARDLGEWLVHVAEERIAGTFNAVRPAEPFGDLLEVCREVSGSDARFVWVDESFLLEREVGQWMELPLWLAGAEAAFIQADVSRAVTAGLRFRPVAETVGDTLAWARETGAPLVAETDRLGAAGMQPGREAELLGAWRARE